MTLLGNSTTFLNINERVTGSIRHAHETHGFFRRNTSSFAAIIWCDARKGRKQKWERTGSIFIASVTGRAQERREKRAGSLNDFCRRGEIGPKNNPAARCGSALIREKPGGGGEVEREAGGAFYAILFHGKQKLYNAIFQRFYCYTCT